MPTLRRTRDFPDTSWSSILGDAERDPEHWRARFGEWAEAYRDPIASWFRAVVGPSEPVEDLCQDFFVRLMERNVLGAFDARRGRLRHFLKGALRNFAREHRRFSRAACRTAIRIPLDEHASETVDDATPGPDSAFDRVFATTVVRRALTELEHESNRRGAGLPYQLFLAHDLHGSVDGQEAAARAFGQNRDWVKNHLAAMRSRFHAALRRVLQATTANSEEALASLREILSS